jgi:hypothetical protein
MGELPQALEIIFEVQMKKSNEKIARRKISFFQLTKCILYLFFLFILYDLKCYRNVTFGSTNHL